ncbi:MAG: PQQ-binding-like beta-propeller repeat protein, partial [Melioribacteraceae bacterium]
MKKIIITFLIYAEISLSLAQTKKNESMTGTSVEILTQIEQVSFTGISRIFWDNKIFTTGNSGKVTCFDTTGNTVWHREIPSQLVTAPLVTDGQVIIGTVNGEVISLIAHTGEQIQSLGIDDTVTTDLTSLNYEGNKELFLPKQSDSKTALIFGTSSGTLYCLDLETLQEYWRNNDSRGEIFYTPLVVQNKIIFSGSDGYIYSIDARSGLLNWRWKETETTDFSKSVIVSDGRRIYAAADDSQLYCLDLLLGKLVWKTERLKILPAIGLSADKKRLFAKTDDKRFLIFSADKGTITKQIKMDEQFDSSR